MRLLRIVGDEFTHPNAPAPPLTTMFPSIKLEAMMGEEERKLKPPPRFVASFWMIALLAMTGELLTQ